ncbi:MAG TPA: transglutaminase-like domain-containing protein [Burkholderiales bacterium]
MIRFGLRTLLLAPIIALSGCASLYFEDAGAPPQPPPRHELAAWPYREYWTGIVFNGNKIGFSRLRIEPEEPGLYRLVSEASLRLRFLGIDKIVRLVGTDWVDEELRLQRFAHDYHLDGSDLALRGRVERGLLRVEIVRDGEATVEEHTLDEAIYPAAALPLVPVQRGLAVGRRYAYLVYDGQAQSLARAEQTIEGYERSELFEGPAFKVRNRLHGHSATTWIDARGYPVFELALNGVLISALEDEASAKRYLVAASLSKDEVLLDFSLIRPDRPLPQARSLEALKIAFTGLDFAALPPADRRQRCTAAGTETICEIRATDWLEPAVDPARYLASTLTVPAAHPRLRAVAADAAAGARSDAERVERLIAWIERNIRKEAADVFSALDVLDRRRAECQGHAYLYAAFARSLDIPTRVVNGIAYSEAYGGFLYHSWNESFVDGAWRAVDPTFGQARADATHVKLIEGERPADLLPLADLVGRLAARVLEAAPAPESLSAAKRWTPERPLPGTTTRADIEDLR